MHIIIYMYFLFFYLKKGVLAGSDLSAVEILCLGLAVRVTLFFFRGQ